MNIHRSLGCGDCVIAAEIKRRPAIGGAQKCRVMRISDGISWYDVWVALPQGRKQRQNLSKRFEPPKRPAGARPEGGGGSILCFEDFSSADPKGGRRSVKAHSSACCIGQQELSGNELEMEHDFGQNHSYSEVVD